MIDLIREISQQPVYLGIMFFLGAYPVITGLFWITGSVYFSVHRETEDEAFYALEDHPLVSVVVPAHNEEGVIVETIECLLQLDWPCFEVMVVDDGSTDATRAILQPYVESGSSPRMSTRARRWR